ncbi:hypothetical protein OAL14_09205 [Gammaproteobacteria bacterium]|nr:hypothetical protein [Gammaproteobacteria bacterium]
MIKRIGSLISLIPLLISSLASADAHEAQSISDLETPQAIQIQLCNLNEGKTLAQYDKLNSDYFSWSEKNNVSTNFIRHTPLFTHSNASKPGYDYIEYLIGPHEVLAENWDKWMNTKEGQKLNARWQDIATCHVKLGTLYMRWVNEEANAADDNRIVTMDWCTRKDSVSWDQLTAKHDQIEASYPEGVQNIVWAMMFPQIGSADAPGDFAHVNVYPDMQAFMKRHKWLSHDSGWKLRDDYTSSYADCRGDEAFVEDVLYRVQ